MSCCNKCGVGLVVGINWTQGCANNKTYTCNTCRAEYQRAYHKANKENMNQRNRDRYYKNRDHILEQQKYREIEKRYGLSKEEYLELMDDAECGICGKRDDLCVDHSHSTGKVRGVLCRQCNQGIGLLGDEYESVIRALEYLNDSRVK